MFWIASILLVCSLLILLFGWARSVTVVYAWYPNSHDKITCYALDLLHQGQPRTLLGWLLQQIRWSPVNSDYRYHLEGQLRRASIEEDMNSYATFLDIELTAGANGAYHFFNALTTQGLTDSDYALFTAGLATGSKPPMPSALERASSAQKLDPGWRWTGQSSWHFDRENRNYTLEDAVRYFEMGYTHIAFYALGRVAHLLQDMAVPAHVRNDSHSGIKNPITRVLVDLPDALEKLASHQDGYDMKWDFDSTRVYSSASVPMFYQAREVWQRYRDSYKLCDLVSLFRNLAEWTSKSFYSYNTIPGNADSHAFDTVYSYLSTPAKLLRDGQSVDWEKCDVNVDAVWTGLRKFGEEAEHMREVLQTLGEAGPAKLDIVDICDGINRSLSDLQNVLSKINAFMRDWVLDSHVQTGSPRRQDLPQSYRNRLERMDILALTERFQNLRWSYQNRFEKMDIPALIGAVSGSTDVIQCLRRWVEGVPEKQLIEGFEGLHGPFDLNTRILTKQWMETESRAIAFSAFLLANFFEERYVPQPDQSMGLWLNKDADGLLTKPKVEVIEDAMTSGAATFGFTNNLPATLDFTLELEMLEDGTDPDIWENGLELEINWGRKVPDMIPTEIPQPTFEGTLQIGGPGSAQTNIGLEPSRKWGLESLPALQLTKEKPRPEVPIAFEALEPFNIANLRLIVPHDGATGGILREAENQLPPMESTPRPAEEQSRLNAVFVRIIPRAMEPNEEGQP